MTITDKLEGLLPADGNLTTKDERVIAEAVAEIAELRRQVVEWQTNALQWEIAYKAGPRPAYQDTRADRRGLQDDLKLAELLGKYNRAKPYITFAIGLAIGLLLRVGL